MPSWPNGVTASTIWAPARSSSVFTSPAPARPSLPSRPGSRTPWQWQSVPAAPCSSATTEPVSSGASSGPDSIMTKQKRTTIFSLYRSARERVQRPKHRAIHLLCTAILAASFALHQDTPTLAAPALQTIAVVGGQPDDITVDNRGRLVWGDLATNMVDRLQGGRVVTVARGISVPEGIVVLPNGSLIVAEQGRDRILRLNGRGGSTVLYTLSPVAGQEGVDGIGRDPTTGDLLVPDSPRGTILRMSVTGGRARV